jgi:uncharacterized Tic20 family protein
MLCHLSALAMLLFSWGGVLGPLIVWLLKRRDSATVDENGKESLNFQITIYIVYIIAGFILVGSTGLGVLWGSPLVFVGAGFSLFSILNLIQLLDIILVIVASVRTNRGETYRYPFSIRLIK